MYVITGATGNTGNVAARALLGLGQKVRVVGRSAERLQTLATEGAEVFVADLHDAAQLTKAFTGATAVYAMIPPNMASNDFRGEQLKVAEALSQALAEAKVEYVVSLSSIGADKDSSTGPILGLHHLELKLNQVQNLNSLHLRAAYFMENTLAQVGIIKMMGVSAGPVRGDVKIPMIATRDIGTAAAQSLLQHDFSGHQAKELLGQRDLTMNEVASIIGNAIGKPDLRYLAVPDEQVRVALMQQGASANVADLILEMAGALNTGHVAALEQRSSENTTETSYETFVSEVLLPAYRA